LVATTLPLRRRISGGSSISILPSTQSWASPCT
jgi:hypothetical protein